MSFLTIPGQEGLFTAVRNNSRSSSTEEGQSVDDGDDEEEDDDDMDEIRFIPRCSPVPRKRGHSLYDETAEYLRIHSTLPAASSFRRRVSFADATGGDLVYVKEFVAFDSDDEDSGSSSRWELEEARYRKPTREPTYRVSPDHTEPTRGALTRALHANKVAVEQLVAVDGEPLAFSGIVRVLNISFHKAVYIRSTMDGWSTYFDLAADYVQGSNDGETDAFSFKLSFAPPYLTHGSRVEFVVRYETSDGDYWANNSQMNYAVTLLLSYEEEAKSQATATMREFRGILKASAACSMEDDPDFDSNEEEEELQIPTATLVRPIPVCIVMPEIDIEAENGPPCLLFAPIPDQLPSVDGTLSPTVVPENNHKDSSFLSRADLPLPPAESEPLPKPHCELDDRTPAQSGDGSPPAFPSVDGTLSLTVVSEDNHKDSSFSSRADLPLPPAESEPLPKPPCELDDRTPARSGHGSPPALPFAFGPYPSVCSVSIGTADSERRRDETPTLDDPEPDAVADSSVAKIRANNAALDKAEMPAPRPATVIPRERLHRRVSPETTRETTGEEEDRASKQEEPEARESLDDAVARGPENRFDLRAETGPRSDRPDAGGEDGSRSECPDAGGEDGSRSERPDAGGEDGSRSERPEAGGEDGSRSERPEAGGEDGSRSERPEAGGEDGSRSERLEAGGEDGSRSERPDAGGEDGSRSERPDAGGEDGSRSERPDAGGEEAPGPVASCARSPYTAACGGPTPGEDGVSRGLATHHRPAEPASYSVSSAPVASQAARSEPPSYSVSSAPVASQAARSEPPSYSVSSAPVASQAARSEPPSYSVSSAPVASQAARSEPPSYSVSSAPVASQAARSERGVWRNVILSVVFLCAAIFFSIVLH